MDFNYFISSTENLSKSLIKANPPTILISTNLPIRIATICFSFNRQMWRTKLKTKCRIAWEWHELFSFIILLNNLENWRQRQNTTLLLFSHSFSLKPSLFLQKTQHSNKSIGFIVSIQNQRRNSRERSHSMSMKLYESSYWPENIHPLCLTGILSYSSLNHRLFFDELWFHLLIEVYREERLSSHLQTKPRRITDVSLELRFSPTDTPSKYLSSISRRRHRPECFVCTGISHQTLRLFSTNSTQTHLKILNWKLSREVWVCIFFWYSAYCRRIEFDWWSTEMQRFVYNRRFGSSSINDPH